MGRFQKVCPRLLSGHARRWQRLLRARPDARQINAKAPCGPIVEMGQTVPARTTRFLRNQAETD